MSFLRSGRCPACHSDKVAVVTPSNLKLLFGLNLTLGIVLVSFVAGFAMSRMARSLSGFQEIAQVFYYWNVFAMLPVGLMLVPVYFVFNRGASKKRHCKACGKKWKVRPRNRHRGIETSSPQQAS